MSCGVTRCQVQASSSVTCFEKCFRASSVMYEIQSGMYKCNIWDWHGSRNQRLTCVCVWWRWRACRPSSWWWSCRSAGPGIPPPSSETRAAASLWPSCRPTGRSPECPRSGGGTLVIFNSWSLWVWIFSSSSEVASTHILCVRSGAWIKESKTSFISTVEAVTFKHRVTTVRQIKYWL